MTTPDPVSSHLASPESQAGNQRPEPGHRSEPETAELKPSEAIVRSGDFTR